MLFFLQAVGIDDCLVILPIVDVTVLKSGLPKEEEDDDQAGSIHNLPVTSQKPLYDGPMPTPRQRPFQSSSTPLHLTHRFMVSFTSALNFKNSFSSSFLTMFILLANKYFYKT
jgi:hypothetical protein